MPISYAIDRQLGIIIETWQGDVHAEDLRSYWQRCVTDPTFLELRTTLADLRAANICFSGEEMMTLITSVVLPQLAGRDWQTAIVVEQPVQFGVSRQYQMFADHYSRDSIFHSYDEALCWLLRTNREAGAVHPGT